MAHNLFRSLPPLPRLSLALAAIGFAGFAALTGCGGDPAPGDEQPADPALKQVLSDAYCSTQQVVSLICGKIEGFEPGARYVVQVAKDDSFNDVVSEQEVKTSSYAFPSKWSGDYHWRLLKTAPTGAVLVAKKVQFVNFHDDDDGDGLSNGLEMNGLVAWDLPKLGANYQRKDIIVYMDTMSTAYLPSSDGFDRIVKVFNDGPVANPNGQTGINLILIAGKIVPYDESLSPVTPEFMALKRQYFPEELRGIAHYMIWAHGHSDGTSSGYSFGIPAYDFVVTLGRWSSTVTDDAKVGTFIHELGHNLGLRHGGKTDIPFSPNYLSVMNYDFQMDGVIKNGQRVFDFQRIETLSLFENNLNELAGIGPEAAQNGYGTIYRCTLSGNRYKVVQMSVASGIDWNCDGVLSTGVTENIDASTSGGQSLIPQNDWANLNLAFIRQAAAGGAMPVSDPPKELTLEEYLAFKELKTLNLPPPKQP